MLRFKLSLDGLRSVFFCTSGECRENNGMSANEGGEYRGGFLRMEVHFYGEKQQMMATFPNAANHYLRIGCYFQSTYLANYTVYMALF